MNNYVAGTNVPPGIYLSLSPMDLAIVDDDGALVGPSGANYLRVPFILAIAMGPLVGGLYAVAFPLLILWAVTCALGQSLASVRTYTAGESGPWGLYVGLNRVSVRYVSASGERIPGSAGTRFLKVPAWISVLASPFIGGAYVVFFPVILAAALVVVLAELGYAIVTRRWADHAHLASARFTPAASYLAPVGEESKEKQNVAGESDELAELEQEARARQASERDGGGEQGGGKK